MLELQFSKFDLYQQAREALAMDGYFYAQDLPSGFDYLDFTQEFGKLSLQYHGDAIGKIEVKPGFDDIYHAQNTKELDPHTECYEYPGTPPKYLALWCVRPSEIGSGYTLLASLERFYKECLSSEDQVYLSETRLQFSSTSGLQKEMLAKRPVFHPLVEWLPNAKPVFRFSKRCMSYQEDARLERIVTQFEQYFHSRRTQIAWKVGAFLIWDNHLFTHARTSFNDRRRQLFRVWIG